MVAWLKRRCSAVHFDLGAAGLRACQLRGDVRQPQLSDVLRIDRGHANEGAEPTVPEPDAALLARLVGQGQFRGSDVGLVLAAPDVQFFPLRLPDAALAQPPERIERALQLEIAQQSRKEAEDLEVRYWALPQTRTQQPNVLAVALSRARALQWFDQAARCGLHLRRVQIAPCAVTRLACQVVPPKPGDMWGVLELGLRHTTLTVIAHETPVYVRVLPGSMHRWTNQIAGAFEVPFAVAEQLKRTHGVQPSERGIRPGPGVVTLASDIPGALFTALHDALQTLSVELRRCFSYVMQAYPELGNQRLLLTGGGANLQGLAEFLGLVLGIPVARLEPALGEGAGGVRVPEFTPADAAVLGAALLDLEAP